MRHPDHPSAEKLLIARSPDGEEWELRISVWPPQEAELAPWACKVEISRLFTPARSIYGEDSWQAQMLAMRFAANRIQHFIEQGGSLYWPSPGAAASRVPFELSDLGLSL